MSMTSLLKATTPKALTRIHQREKMTNDFAVLKKAFYRYTNGYTNDKNMVCLCPRQE